MEINNEAASNSDIRIGELEKQLSALNEQIHFLERENNFVREEKEKYQLIADYALDWEFWIDPKGAFKWISPACIDITGYTANEFFQDSSLLNEIIYGEDLNRFRKFIHDKTINISLCFDVYNKTKNGAGSDHQNVRITGLGNKNQPKIQR